MRSTSLPRWLLATLLLAAVILPLIQGVLFWVEKLLAAMNDATGAAVVGRLLLAGGILWAIDLVALVVALAIWCYESEPPE